QRNRLAQAIPFCSLDVQAPLSSGCQCVELGVAPAVRRAPVSAEPAAFLKTVEGRVERPLLHPQRFARDLIQSLGDRVPMNRTEGGHLKNQEIERALEQ